MGFFLFVFISTRSFEGQTGRLCLSLPRRTTAKLAGGSALLQTETCIAKILTWRLICSLWPSELFQWGDKTSRGFLTECTFKIWNVFLDQPLTHLTKVVNDFESFSFSIKKTIWNEGQNYQRSSSQIFKGGNFSLLLAWVQSQERPKNAGLHGPAGQGPLYQAPAR